MTSEPTKAMPDADPADLPSAGTSEDADHDPVVVEPTDEEIEAWAARERERRRAWLEGPSDAERADWVRRERARRLGELSPEARAAELARLGRRYGRETQLVAEGAASLMWTWSRRAFAELARMGLEWEESAGRSPRKQRVNLDDEGR
jgi:hypothetical protein